MLVLCRLRILLRCFALKLLRFVLRCTLARPQPYCVAGLLLRERVATVQDSFVDLTLHLGYALVPANCRQCLQSHGPTGSHGIVMETHVPRIPASTCVNSGPLPISFGVIS